MTSLDSQTPCRCFVKAAIASRPSRSEFPRDPVFVSSVLAMQRQADLDARVESMRATVLESKQDHRNLQGKFPLSVVSRPNGVGRSGILASYVAKYRRGAYGSLPSEHTTPLSS